MPMHLGLSCCIALLCASAAIASVSATDVTTAKRILWSRDYEKWIQPLAESGRRELFGMNTNVDDKCLEACPDMKNAQKALGFKMLDMMDKYQTTDGQLDQDRMGEFMGEMVAAMIDNMCKNKAAYKCAATHSDCKQKENTNSNCDCGSTAQSGANSTQSSSSSCNCQQQQQQQNSLSLMSSPEQFGESIDCFCDACPELGCALGSYLGELLGAFADAFSSNNSTQSNNEATTKKVMDATCGLVDPMKCVTSNPDKCKVFMEDKQNQQMEEGVAKMADQCKNDNIPTGPAQCTIGMDESKKDGAGKQGSHAIVFVIASMLVFVHLF